MALNMEALNRIVLCRCQVVSAVYVSRFLVVEDAIRHTSWADQGSSARQLAEKIDVPANRLTDIIRGRRGISADTAQRLAVYFDTTPVFWMNLQANHDLSMAARENDYSRIKPRSGAAA